MPLITLPEYAKGFAKEDMRRAVINMFTKYSDIFEVWPFETLSGSSYVGYRSASLPSPAFRGVNEGSTAGHGIISPFQESTYIIDHDVDVDRAIVDRHGPERRNYETEFGVTAFARLWVDNLIKGDQSTQPRVFNGLQVRANKYSRNDHNSAAAGGAALSLTKLDTAINRMKNPTHIIAPYASRPLWIQAARNTTLTGFVLQTFGGKGDDSVGGLKMSYAGLDFLWGYPFDDHAPVLDFNETASGGVGAGSVTASLYVVSLGEGLLRGLQLVPLTPEDVGLLQDRKTFRTHIKWDVGIVDEHKFCLRRLDSWTNAPIVA